MSVLSIWKLSEILKSFIGRIPIVSLFPALYFFRSVYIYQHFGYLYSLVSKFLRFDLDYHVKRACPKKIHLFL